MKTRYVIFIVVASILTMALYSSSINFVSGAGKVNVWGAGSTVCSFSNNGNAASCSTQYTQQFCTYDTAAEKWSCVKAKTSSGSPSQMPGSESLSKMTDSQIPLGLKSALDSAIKSQNGSLVIGQSAQGNSSESTINNSPKTSSQVPQTSAQRQTPNNSFGSMIVK